MALTIQFQLPRGWFPSNSFCEGFCLVMPPLWVKFISFKLFLDFTWGPIYKKSHKNGSPCSVFWIFMFFLLKLNLGHEHEFNCIWASLINWSLPSLVSTPLWIFGKNWKLSVLLVLQVQHVLPQCSKISKFRYMDDFHLL